MLTVADGEMIVYDAGSWLSCKQFSAIRQHHEIDIDYWPFNSKDKRPEEVSKATFKARSNWTKVGLHSEVIFGHIFIANRPVREQLTVTNKRVTLAVYR